MRIQQKSDMMDQDNSPAPAINSPLVEYKTASKQALYVSKVANTNTSTRQQYIPTAGPTLNTTTGVNMFNVQLNYNPD